MRRLLLALVLLAPAAARADDPEAWLARIHKHVTLSTTVPDNGDQNPYAVVVAPVSAGKIRKDDVLITNFNNIANLQGLGTTIMIFRPATRETLLFAKLPRTLAQCPGGVGLGTALAMLNTGWVIVGSTPSNDGTTRTRGDGCLLVLDPEGNVAATWSGLEINDPWGNMAVIDNGATAALFVSMAGYDVQGPEIRDPGTNRPVVHNKATVVRIDLAIPAGKPPQVRAMTIIADGLGSRADKDVFIIGPTGLALGANDTLYASDAIGNRIVAIDHASTRRDSAGTGREITRDGLLKRPLALIMTPTGHLLTTNGTNGQIVEIDAATGKQIAAQWIDANQAQSPPGNGDLFGLAIKPDGSGFYYVEDDMNTIVEAR